jgi:hypothetical protein
LAGFSNETGGVSVLIAPVIVYERKGTNGHKNTTTIEQFNSTEIPHV